MLHRIKVGPSSHIQVDPEQFLLRMLQDCLTEATATYWERRARTFDDAAPRAGDFNGLATAAELRERSQRCKETAALYRSRARIIASATGQPLCDEVLTVAKEAA
jgi:hypothetical protein